MSGCSKQPERLVNQHPPVPDLEVIAWSADVPVEICTTEPPVPSEAELDADPLVGLRWEAETLARGRACRDAHTRACKWHADMARPVPLALVCDGRR